MSKDWITTFMNVTAGLRSPPIFRLWAGISVLAGVLQRRVWTETETGATYPNLYVMLAGGPATGKSLSVIEARKLWKSIPNFAIGPDNPTQASLMRRLSDSGRLCINGDAAPTIMSSLTVPCEEFSNLITKFDIPFLAFLSHVWNNPPDWDAPRETKESYRVQKPGMNILGAVTPDTLGSTFPDSAWGQGITSRIVFVFSEEVKFDNTNFFRKKTNIEKTKEIIDPLLDLFTVSGEVEWTSAAQEAHISWWDKGMPPVPSHGRLKYWNGRRNEHMVKLAMIASFSAGRRLLVEEEDYDRAKGWLLEAERYMPDVFRAMGQKSDIQIIEDMHFYLWRLYIRQPDISKRTPIADDILVAHLSERTPSMNILKVIEMAERAGWIRRVRVKGETMWVPRPLAEVEGKIQL